MLKKIFAPLVAVFSLLAGSVAFAQVTLPAAATDAITEADGLAQAMLDAGWVIVVTVAIGFLLYRLFKRVARG